MSVQFSTFTTNARPRTGYIQIIAGQGMSTLTMCLASIAASYSVFVQQWMFFLCRKLQMIGIYTRLIAACVMQLSLLRYFAKSQCVTKAMNHVPGAISFDSLWSSINVNTSVSIDSDVSQPLPTAIWKYFVMLMEIGHNILFLETRSSPQHFPATQDVIDGFYYATMKLSKFWCVCARNILLCYTALFFVLKDAFWHNITIMGIGT